MRTSLQLILVIGVVLSGEGRALPRSQSQPVGEQRLVIVPPHKLAAGQWVERVWGDPQAAGEMFAIRIHNDPGYMVLPHAHPTDEHIVVSQGTWWFAMGNRFDESALKPVQTGGFAMGPKNMPHFAWSKTETTVHVYGIGPFGSKLVDPVYERTAEGTFLLSSLLQPGTSSQSSPPDCFKLAIGVQVRGPGGTGHVVGARCSPANRITQYWVNKPDGDRYWARLEELSLM